jgi:hypothetical protein
MVTESSATVMVTLNVSPAPAVAGLPIDVVHALLVKRRTVAPASALPETTGEFALAGEAGVVDDTLGAAGGRLSWMYVSGGAEQADTLPAASVAVAAKFVVEFDATVTPRPKVPPVAVPVAATGPVQSAAR